MLPNNVTLNTRDQIILHCIVQWGNQNISHAKQFEFNQIQTNLAAKPCTQSVLIGREDDRSIGTYNRFIAQNKLGGPFIVGKSPMGLYRAEERLVCAGMLFPVGTYNIRFLPTAAGTRYAQTVLGARLPSSWPKSVFVSNGNIIDYKMPLGFPKIPV